MADRPGDSDPSNPPVAVATVATPAEWGLDGARLTEHVVDRLEAHGYRARWHKTSSERRRLRCAVRLPPFESFAAGYFVEGRARCRLVLADGSELRVSQTRQAAGRTPPNRQPPSEALTVVGESAAERALDAAVDRLADKLAD